jgi:hypothetical protein
MLENLGDVHIEVLYKRSEEDYSRKGRLGKWTKGEEKVEMGKQSTN